MSHYFAVVLVQVGDGPDAVAKLLAPWNEETTQNDGWWDWYRLGGRWDGKVRGIDAYGECPNCSDATDAQGFYKPERAQAAMKCHYSDRHETWENNHVPVAEIGEVLPFTVVKPDGSFTHRAGLDGPWTDDGPRPTYVEKPDAEWQREVAEIMMAHRYCIAVGVDYHS